MKIVKEPHGPTAYNTQRKQAWRNMMVAAINAGLEQQLFSLAAGDNRWPGYGSAADPQAEEHLFSFMFPGEIPAYAYVRDCGHGELSIHVALWPTERRDLVRARGAGLHAGDAFAEGWLARAEKAWLQTGPSQVSCRTAKLNLVANCTVEPRGFADRGPIAHNGPTTRRAG